MLKNRISGEVGWPALRLAGWQQKSYAVSSGIHTLKWRYVKDGSGYSGDDCGWVDFVQWSGPSPAQDPANWQEIAYKHDLHSRRVVKKVDGYSTRYIYDGDHVVAEYDGNNNLLRKYIYGPGSDQPVSMIEVAQSNATYYYHFDALGSVVALSDSAGDTVQTYQYSVYGEVAVEDPNHTNPYMFTGRSFDVEIGLYYNRARYYNPFMGRFLQADPIGYEAGMNLYSYCMNNALNMVDPLGTRSAIYGAGNITIDSSCNSCKMCILPEDTKVWDCNSHSGQEYEADAVGWYNADGSVVDGLKVADNCEAWVYCTKDPNDPNWVEVSYKAICAGWALPHPTPVTPGQGWVPPLPPSVGIPGVTPK